MSVRSFVLLAVASAGTLLVAPRPASAQDPAAVAKSVADAPSKPTADLTDDELAKFHADRIAGKSADAIAALENHPAVKAGKKRAIGMLGLMYRDAGRIEEANRLALTDASYKGHCFEMLMFLGWTFPDIESKPDYTGSRALFQLALKERPGNVEAEYGLARSAALERPSVESARKLLEFKAKASQLPAHLFDRTAPMTLAVVADSLIVFGQRDADTLGLLRSAIELDPDQVDAALVLARELAAKNDPESEQILARIEKEHPERNADVMFLRATMAQQAGDADLALQNAEKALTLSGRAHPLALILACELRLAKKELERVRADIDRLAAMQSKTPEIEPRVHALYIQYRIASAAQRQKPEDKLSDLKDAKSHCDKLLAVDATNPQVLAWVKEIDAELAKLPKQ